MIWHAVVVLGGLEPIVVLCSMTTVICSVSARHHASLLLLGADLLEWRVPSMIRVVLAVKAVLRWSGYDWLYLHLYLRLVIEHSGVVAIVAVHYFWLRSPLRGCRRHLL